MLAYCNSKENAELIYVYLDKLYESDWRINAENLEKMKRGLWRFARVLAIFVELSGERVHENTNFKD